jgi:hypothetical protein
VPQLLCEVWSIEFDGRLAIDDGLGKGWMGSGCNRVFLFLGGRICNMLAYEKFYTIEFLRYEENISTARPQKEEHARVSGTHGHEEWPEGT